MWPEANIKYLHIANLFSEPTCGKRDSRNIYDTVLSKITAYIYIYFAFTFAALGTYENRRRRTLFPEWRRTDVISARKPKHIIFKKNLCVFFQISYLFDKVLPRKRALIMVIPFWIFFVFSRRKAWWKFADSLLRKHQITFEAVSVSHLLTDTIVNALKLT